MRLCNLATVNLLGLNGRRGVNSSKKNFPSNDSGRIVENRRSSEMQESNELWKMHNNVLVSPLSACSFCLGSTFTSTWLDFNRGRMKGEQCHSSDCSRTLRCFLEMEGISWPAYAKPWCGSSYSLHFQVLTVNPIYINIWALSKEIHPEPKDKPPFKSKLINLQLSFKRRFNAASVPYDLTFSPPVKWVYKPRRDVRGLMKGYEEAHWQELNVYPLDNQWCYRIKSESLRSRLIFILFYSQLRFEKSMHQGPDICCLSATSW